MDQTYEQALKYMEGTVHELAKHVPKPKRISTKNGFVFRYVEKSIHQAIVQKLCAPSEHSLRNPPVPSIYSSARPELDRSPVCRDHAYMISSFVRARPLARPQTQTLSY